MTYMIHFCVFREKEAKLKTRPENHRMILPVQGATAASRTHT